MAVLRNSQLFFGLTVTLDVLGAAAGWALAYAVRFHVGPAVLPGLFVVRDPLTSHARDFAALLPIVIACDLLALGGVGLYRPARARSALRESMRATKAAVLAWIGLLAVLYFVRQTRYSAKFVTLFLFINVAALVGARFALLRILTVMRERGRGLLRAAIVGVGMLGRKTFVRLQANPWVGLRVEYFIDTGGEAPPEVRGVPVVRGGDDFLPHLAAHPVDVVLVAVAGDQAARRDAILRSLAKVPVTVAVMPDLDVEAAMRVSSSVGEFEGMPIIQLRDSPIYGWNAVFKRAIDIAVSAAGLLLLWWLFALVALLVRITSRGPAIFRQERMGLGGRPFTILKFRTMAVGAAEEVEPALTERNDPRCTPVGRWLRRWSLDELPQLVNVLRGEMSLVGPRPERPALVKQFTEELPAYMLRHSVKAGMTGWAQVNGLRGSTSIRERLHYDLFYINKWSLQFDLFILLATPFSGLFSRNAY